jgi:uncharacterized protein (TIGR04141 family)
MSGWAATRGESMPRIRAYLLKDTIAEFVDAMRVEDSVNPPASLTLKEGIGVDGIVYYKEPRRKPPDWLGFLSDGLESPPEFRVATASAVLLLRTRGRVFALTFGFGGTMLASNARVRDFGVRVALNSIDPALIKSVDMRRVEEMTVHTRRQVSRASNLLPFRIDERQDFIRSIGGRAFERLGWKGMVEGADSVAVSCDMTFQELPTLCGQLLELYESTDYVDHGFGFFDNLRLVTDPDELQRLNSTLDEVLASGETSSIHLSLPDAMDLGDINCYKYKGRGQVRNELDVDDMLQELSESGVNVNVEWLENHDLLVNYARSPEADYDRCTLFETIVFETRFSDDAVYVLSAGEWHRVSAALAATVEERLSGIEKCDVAFPDCDEKWTEGQYDREASTCLGHACMHKEIIELGGQAKIESCDLFTSDGQFVHVKRRSKSSTLSHLFFQGMNSARLFLESPEFRERLRAKVAEVSEGHAFLIPEASPDTGQYEVVFGIIGKPGTQHPTALPFFSRLSMADAADILSGMGYRVSYAPIDFAAAP